MPECRDEQGRPIDAYYIQCPYTDPACNIPRGKPDPETWDILQARGFQPGSIRPWCEYARARLDPGTEDLVKLYASRYGVPWQIVAGVLKSEIEIDTEPKDIIETWFWRGATWPFTDLVLRYYRPDPGPGIGNVHVVPAQYVSEYFARNYPDNPEMQLHLHMYSRRDIAYYLTLEEANIKTVSAFVRQLADFRFGSNNRPLLASQSDLSDWTLTDAVNMWHGFRYGVRDVSPPDYGLGFEYISDFQNRSIYWEAGLKGPDPLYIGKGAETSIRDAIPFLQCYLDRCD